MPIPGAQVTSAASVAAGQDSQPGTTVTGQNAVPEEILFELFFNNISALNQVAANDEKAGNHAWAVAWRTHDQRAAGLNDAEGQIMQEITLDCLRMLKEQDAKFRAAAEKFRAQVKPGAPLLIPSELVQMDEDRKKIISDHIERLREALGDASFNKLDTHVHSAFHAEVITPKPAPPPIATTEKSPKESR
jgi:hypothetical protein